MGQKVNPNGLRLGINKDWEAKWYSNKKDFANTLGKDIEIRKSSTGITIAEVKKNVIHR